jgi:hypothetical protein
MLLAAAGGLHCSADRLRAPISVSPVVFAKFALTKFALQHRSRGAPRTC